MRRLLLALVLCCGFGLSHAAEPQLVRVYTNHGSFVIELDAARAPLTVANFLSYVRAGHYSGTVFHRVIANFVAQAGGYDEKFVEKPSAEIAARYVRDGFLWNSGNLLFHVGIMAEEIARLAPELAIASETAVATARRDNGYRYLDQRSFTTVPQISIDYAVMEKTTRAAVVIGNFRWSDIGSWDA